MRALTLSMALVEQTTVRTSASKAKIGTNSAHACSHNLTIAGYLSPQASVNSANRARAADSVGAV
ncbi:hypothetical protein M2303_005757 [Micromonospora sp. H404/HB375]|nr:hypothetical protein [Micromonospora sp. H404/HB375]